MSWIGNLAARKEISKRERVGRFGQSFTERARYFYYTWPLFGSAHYSPQGHYAFSFKELRHRYICSDHEIFDDVTSAVWFGHGEVCDLPRLVHDWRDLNCLQFKRAVSFS